MDREVQRTVDAKCKECAWSRQTCKSDIEAGGLDRYRRVHPLAQDVAVLYECCGIGRTSREQHGRGSEGRAIGEMESAHCCIIINRYRSFAGCDFHAGGLSGCVQTVHEHLPTAIEIQDIAG